MILLKYYSDKLIFQDDPILKIKNVDRTFNGREFTCRVQLRSFTLEDFGRIFVEYRPTLINSSKSYLEIKNNQPVELHCTCEANPMANTEWFHFKELQGSKTKVSEGEILAFPNMTADLEGFFECVVQNEIGRVSKTFQLVDLPVSSPTSKASKEKEQKDVTKGTNLELSCSCDNCIPIKSFSWKQINGSLELKNSFDETFGNFEVKTIQDSSNFLYKLLLKNVSEENGGFYECTLVNSLGNFSQIFNVNVETTPKLNYIEANINGSRTRILENQELKIQENSKLEITIFVSGNPKPQIKWWKDEGEIRNLSLKFDSTDPLVGGSYEVQVSNKLGKIMRNFSIVVEFPPKISENLEQENRTIVTLEKNPVKITCQVNGNPKPEVHWVHNEIYLDSKRNSRYNVTNNDDESIISFNPSLSDSGIFRCFKNNTLGFIFEDYYLVVHGKFESSFANSNFKCFLFQESQK